MRSDDLGVPFVTALRHIFSQAVPNLTSLKIRSDWIGESSIPLQSRMNIPTSLLRHCRLQKLKSLHFEVPLANNGNLCIYLNKHPSLTELSLGHVGGLDSETNPVVLSLPCLERFSAPDYYFYCFSKSVPSLVQAVVWMAPDPQSAQMTLVKQNMKHLTKRRPNREGEPVTIPEPILNYIASIAPSLKCLSDIDKAIQARSLHLGNIQDQT